MHHDIILVIGEAFFDHPLSGPGLLKRLMEKHGYSVGIIEQPRKGQASVVLRGHHGSDRLDGAQLHADDHEHVPVPHREGPLDGRSSIRALWLP